MGGAESGLESETSFEAAVNQLSTRKFNKRNCKIRHFHLIGRLPGRESLIKGGVLCHDENNICQWSAVNSSVNTGLERLVTGWRLLLCWT